MKFRTKSKMFGKWAFVKYLGDGAVYAVCQHCGYTYACYKELRDQDGNYTFKNVPDVSKAHRYCPKCGLKMSLWDNDKVYKIDRYPWEDAN